METTIRLTKELRTPNLEAKLDDMVKELVANADVSLIKKVADVLNLIQDGMLKEQNDEKNPNVNNIKYIWTIEREAVDGRIFNIPIVGMSATNFLEGYYKLDISDNLVELQGPLYQRAVSMLAPMRCKIIPISAKAGEILQQKLKEFVLEVEEEINAAVDIFTSIAKKFKSNLDLRLKETLMREILGKSNDYRIAISDTGNLISIAGIEFADISDNINDFEDFDGFEEDDDDILLGCED